MNNDDLKKLITYCCVNLDLVNTKQASGYTYQSLPQCVIDTVYSLNARYTSTHNVVVRFCNFAHWIETCSAFPPCVEEQHPISEFIRFFDRYGVEYMARSVFQNLQRTSTRNGILKAEAVLRFSQTLHEYGVEYLQDVDKVRGNPEFEEAIKRIPGQTYGTALRYFYIVTGSENYVKPDRMVLRFVESALGHMTDADEGFQLVVDAAHALTRVYPHITPSLLDNLIWNYQRSQN